MEAALAFPQAKILGRHRFGSCVPTRALPQLAASILCCYEGTVDVVLFRNLHRMTTHACCPHSSRFLRGDPQGLPSPWPWMGCGGEGPVWRGKRDSVTGSDGPSAAWAVCHVRSCREGYLKRQGHAELLCLLLRRTSKTWGARLLTLSKYLTGLILSSVLKTLPPGSKDNLVIPRLPHVTTLTLQK